MMDMAITGGVRESVSPPSPAGSREKKPCPPLFWLSSDSSPTSPAPWPDSVPLSPVTLLPHSLPFFFPLPFHPISSPLPSLQNPPQSPYRFCSLCCCCLCNLDVSHQHSPQYPNFPPSTPHPAASRLCRCSIPKYQNTPPLHFSDRLSILSRRDLPPLLPTRLPNTTPRVSILSCCSCRLRCGLRALSFSSCPTTR
ncbi:hypothetical protein EX30DRAFT_207038 [Ascodesmis nigricans]|uniref:Uncharacterized protein n=1 Tax=Ascodesmis nigricans TaxID=341454 RepID=A0A4S2MJR9_9PEZI|nr:hypothetical protein EX30DRAFT_207038 [Ascodesmis nigricans]